MDNTYEYQSSESDSGSWQVQEAKAQFSALLDATLADGPQVVTRRGIKTAVVVPYNEWRRFTKLSYRDVKEWLLAPEARIEQLVPEPLDWQLRPPPSFE